MDASYTATFSPEEIKQHAQLINKINNETIVIVDTKPLDDTRWRVTVVGYDYLGELSLICGLMFVYGLDIIESQAFTYEPITGSESDPRNLKSYPFKSWFDRKKQKLPIFRSEMSGEKLWMFSLFDQSTPNHLLLKCGTIMQTIYIALLTKMQAGQRREARGELAKRVGEVFQEYGWQRTTPLYPIDIEIDNNSSKLYTILKIGTPDTVGFLYEFSNALAMNHINIARMFVQSIGNRVNDTIYVTDDEGHKITSPEKQRELRAATVLIKHFTHLLPHSPNPEAALLALSGISWSSF